VGGERSGGAKRREVKEGSVKTFEARAAIPVEPSRVIGVLTDPAACRRWAPVDFEIEDLDEPRLRSGTSARIGGRVAGRPVRFDLSVLEASDRHLALSALGPCEVRARYETERAPGGTEVRASLSIGSRGGLRSRIVSAAAEALLAGGILGRTLDRMAEEMTLQRAVR
jgi:Polyketide cyclase / dehydrase and lipid transport